MALDPELLRQAETARNVLLEAQHQVERARSDYHHVIRKLHASGGTLREIADSLGLSHQRVHQIVEAPAGEAPPRMLPFPPMFGRRGRRTERPRLFERFSDDARQVVALAQEEAQSLRHAYVGTEHLLLGVLRLEAGIAAEVLRQLGIELSAARAQVVAIVGEGEEVKTGRMPFTPRAKKALELALREQQALGGRCIEPEHLLLGLARDPKAVSAQVLARLAVTDAQLTAAIGERLAA